MQTFGFGPIFLVEMDPKIGLKHDVAPVEYPFANGNISEASEKAEVCLRKIIRKSIRSGKVGIGLFMETKAEAGANLVWYIQRAYFSFRLGFGVCVGAMRDLRFPKSESRIGHERRERPLHTEELTRLLTNLVLPRSDDLRHPGVWQCKNGTSKKWSFFAPETFRLMVVSERCVVVGKILRVASEKFSHVPTRPKNSVLSTFRRVTSGIFPRNWFVSFREFTRVRMTQRGEI
jgi:hypothetical protein